MAAPLTAHPVPPRYAPVDEEHYPLPTSTYALSKVASETIAGHIAEWSGIPFVALRLSNIMAPGDYQPPGHHCGRKLPP